MTSAPSKRKSILLVDDDTMKRETLREYLEFFGYNVTTAEEGKSALVLLEGQAFDLAMVDYYMPQMTGDVLAVELKRRRPDLPVVMVSGSLSMTEMVTALVDAVVLASAGPGEVLATVRRIIGE